MWVYYAWIAAVARAVKDLFWKDALDASPTGALEATFLFWLCALVFLAPFAFATGMYFRQRGGRETVQSWVAFRWANISALCNVVAYWMFMEALRRGDLSTALPLRETVPIFALFIGVARGLPVSRMVFISVPLVLGGVYLLHLDQGAQSIEMQVQAVISSTLAFIAAGIFALAALCDQRAMSPDYGGMHPALYAMILVGITEVWYTIGVFGLGKQAETLALFSRTPWWQLSSIGALGALGTVFTAAALRAGPLVEVVVSLRAKVLLGVLLGGVVLQEAGLVTRLIGGGLLMAGVVLAAVKPRR
mgnify:FL=1